MPDIFNYGNFTNNSTLDAQNRSVIGGIAGSANSVVSGLTSSGASVFQAIGDISTKIKSAGTTLAGAASATLNQLGSFTTTTKFADLFKIPDKIQDLTPEETRGDTTTPPTYLYYPNNLGKYFIMFTFKQYYRENTLFKREEGIQCSISLPIPSDLNEKFSVSYNDKSIGILGVLQEAGAVSSIASGASGVNANTIAYNVGKQVSDSGNLAKILQSVAGNFITDAGQAAADRITGTVLNPYNALQFQGVGLRKHSFKFRMSPNSKAEADTLKRIILEFKRRMHPEKVGLRLNYPDVCTIQFATENMPYSFKNCYLEGLTVNYAPSGVPSFLKDGQFTSEVEITLDFGEIEIVTRNDLKTVNGNLTGAVGVALSEGSAGLDAPPPRVNTIQSSPPRVTEGRSGTGISVLDNQPDSNISSNPAP